MGCGVAGYEFCVWIVNCFVFDVFGLLKCFLKGFVILCEFEFFVGAAWMVAGVWILCL